MGQFNTSFSCKRCRQRKVRCNRAVPCETCIRDGCEDRCYPYAPPAISSDRVPISRPKTLVHPKARISASRQSAATLRDSAYEQIQRQDGKDARNTEQHSMGVSPSYGTMLSYTVEALHNQLNLTSLTAEGQVKLTTPAFSSFGGTVSLDEKAEWLTYLASNAPNRVQCDILISYFFENINWIYQNIHVLSFMKTYESFWRDTVGEADLIWLSLLFVIMSLSALYIDPRVCETFGLQGSDIRDKAHLWFRLSRQALHVGEFETRPCLTQIQVFVQSQLYWYAIKNVEALNSALGQAMKCAQALGLDKDYAQSTNVASEMRHRMWWELCSSDLFQAFCLGRQPLLQCHLSKVPIPLNCNDSDMSTTKIVSRPMDEPTRKSVHVVRTKLFQALSKIFADGGAAGLSYNKVCEVDAEVLNIVDSSPWYMTSTVQEGPKSTALPGAFEHLAYQNHISHVFICVQRIRMYRPFLRTEFRQACWSKCIDAVESIFTIYHSIRRRAGGNIQHSPKMHVGSYQIFCAGVSIAMFLLVEQPTLSAHILNDIEVVMQDLKQLIEVNDSVPMAKDGRATLAKILSFYHSLHPDGRSDLIAVEDVFSTRNVAALAQEVYSHMGGTVKTLNYLDRDLEAERNDRRSRICDKQATTNRGAAFEVSPTEDASTHSPEMASYDQFGSVDIDSIQDDTVFSSSWLLDVHYDVMSWPLEDFPGYGQSGFN